MKEPISFQPIPRLAELLRRGGGVAVDAAAEQATQRVQLLRDRCIAVLNDKIEGLAQAAGEGAGLAKLYAHASEIFSLGATFGLEEFAQASSSLCDLLTWTQQQQTDAVQAKPGLLRAIAVHVDALRTLRRPELSEDAAARSSVLEGLRQVALRYKTD